MSAVFALVFKRLLSQRFTLLMWLGFPLAVLVIPMFDDTQPPVGPFGLFGLVIMFTSFLISKQIIEDRQLRTVVRIAASPISHRDYLLGHLLGYALIMTVQVILFVVISAWRYPTGLTFYLPASALLWVFSLMCVTLALFWHTFFKSFNTSLSIFSIGANLMAVMGGMMFPLSVMPDRMRSVAVILPTYWFAFGLEEAARNVVSSVLLSLAILVGFGIIFITIGSKRSYE